MKSGKSFLSILYIVLFALTVLTAGCKKESATAKLIDQLPGTYIAYDSVKITPPGICGSDSYTSYTLIISKESETSVNLSVINGCANEKASVSDNNITLVTALCIDNFSPAINRSGTSLNFTYSMIPGAGCTGAGTIKAVKQ